MHPLFKNSQRGQAILIAVLFFLAISLTVVLGVATPILQAVKIGNDLIHSKASYFLAEGALEDAVYRVKNGDMVNNGGTITVDGYTTTISVVSDGSDQQTIEASADYNNVYRNMQATVSAGTGASFSYGLQAGAGGFYISGGSTINGSVYSNGPIIGSSGTITGAAISANSASLTADQTNNSPTPITTCTSATCISFGNSSATQDIAQSFQVSTDGPLHDIQFYLKEVGSPSNITVKIVADNNGSPSSNDLLSTDGSIAASAVSTSGFDWVDATFPSNITLYTGETYWVVLYMSKNSSKNYYITGANNAYANGVAKIGKFGSSWSSTSPAGLDAYFELYLGGVYGTVCGSGSATTCQSSYTGQLTVGSGGSGIAWAHQVSGTSVAGTMYCEVGGTGSPYYDNKTCDISRSDPPAIAMPVSDGNIQDWENQVTSSISGGWTYQGDLTPSWQGTTTSTLTHITGNFSSGSGNDTFTSGLEVDGNMTISNGSKVTAGPLLVKGNLTIGSTGLILTGILWVQGSITVSSGAHVQLASSYGSNSGIIISNGPMDLSGGGSLSGSGQSGSYLLLVTTSDCPISASCNGASAISISGGAGAVILYAPHGTMSMSGGTHVNAMAADYITITGGSVINYDSGLVNLNFSNGPSGGWNVSGWGEVP